MRYGYGTGVPSKDGRRQESGADYADTNGYNDDDSRPEVAGDGGELSMRNAQEPMVVDLPNALEEKGLVSFKTSFNVTRTLHAWENNGESVEVVLDPPAGNIDWNAVYLDSSQINRLDDRLDRSQFIIWKIEALSGYQGLRQPIAISFADENMKHANQMQAPGQRVVSRIIQPGTFTNPIVLCDKTKMVGSQTYARGVNAPDYADFKSEVKVHKLRDGSSQASVLRGGHLHATLLDMGYNDTDDTATWVNAPLDIVGSIVSLTKQFQNSMTTLDVKRHMKLEISPAGKQGNVLIPLGTGSDWFNSLPSGMQEDVRHQNTATVNMELLVSGTFNSRERPQIQVAKDDYVETLDGDSALLFLEESGF